MTKRISPDKIHPETQQILHKNNFFDDFPNFNENLYMYHIWYIMVIVNFYVMWICITYDTTCLLTTSQWRPLHCIIFVTPQQERGRTIPLRNIWKYVYCIIYSTECSEGLIYSCLLAKRVFDTALCAECMYSSCFVVELNSAEYLRTLTTSVWRELDDHTLVVGIIASVQAEQTPRLIPRVLSSVPPGTTFKIRFPSRPRRIQQFVP
jgi:hypothetical protein